MDEPSKTLGSSAAKQKADGSAFARLIAFFATFFRNIGTFFRQVIAELRKVVTPTRKELFSFTGVVLVFVLIMMGIVWVLDELFSILVVFVFGSSPL